MRKVKVTLDGSEFEVQELRSRENADWRSRLEEHFEELASAVEGASGVEVTVREALGGLVRAVGGKLLRSVDLIQELVVAYAPDLESVIEDAYDSEMLDAFVGVLGLAYPFGGMLERMRELGEMLPQT